MGSLTFAGLGLSGSDSITFEAVNAAKEAGIILLELYTSPISTDDVAKIGKIFGKEVKVVPRDYIEDGKGILELATKADVLLLVVGDPMVATTHMDLKTRAESMNIRTRILHNASIISAVPGATGLHVYNFGKIVTLTGGNTPPATAYHTIFQNMLRGLHTLLLLEIQVEEGYSLKPGDGLNLLLSAEKDIKFGLIGRDTFVIVVSRLGSPKDFAISAGKLSDLTQKNYGYPPHAIVIPGKLHFTEIEALKNVSSADGQVRDNTTTIRKRSEIMVTGYTKKARKALAKARKKVPNEFQLLFENVECYISDAERFLKVGEDELAVLSIGYAEGLLDALRFTGQLEIEW
ncbi:MAG: diphthine synthase [Nitrososphaerales archaeon]